MDDDEIIKELHKLQDKWDNEICDKLPFDKTPFQDEWVAIRLYRMAEEQTATQFATKKCCGTSRAPSSAELDAARASSQPVQSKEFIQTLNEAIEYSTSNGGTHSQQIERLQRIQRRYLATHTEAKSEAEIRASEREKCWKGGLHNSSHSDKTMCYDCAIAGEKARTNIKLQEAYAKGKEVGVKASIEICEDCQKEAYKKGQAELIAGFEKAMDEIHEKTAGCDKNNPCNYCADAWTAIKKASESLVGYAAKPKVKPSIGATIGALDKPEKPKTRRRNGYKGRL